MKRICAPRVRARGCGGVWSSIPRTTRRRENRRHVRCPSSHLGCVFGGKAFGLAENWRERSTVTNQVRGREEAIFSLWGLPKSLNSTSRDLNTSTSFDLSGRANENLARNRTAFPPLSTLVRGSRRVATLQNEKGG